MKIVIQYKSKMTMLCISYSSDFIIPGFIMNDQSWEKMKDIVYKWIYSRHDHDKFLKQFAYWLRIQKIFEVCFIFLIFMPIVDFKSCFV